MDRTGPPLYENPTYRDVSQIWLRAASAQKKISRNIVTVPTHVSPRALWVSVLGRRLQNGIDDQDR
jgi:hypothetical protein